MKKQVSKEKFTAYFYKCWAAEGASKHSVGCKFLDALFWNILQMRTNDLPDTCEVDEYRQGLIEVSDNLEEAFELFVDYAEELRDMITRNDFSLFE